MSLLATRADFEPADETEGAAALYYQPHDGTGYDHTAPYFQARLEHIQTLLAPIPQYRVKLAVWGCGFGTLVNLAVQAGYDAYGYDASAYAIARAKTLHPNLGSRAFQLDALNAGQVAESLTLVGLRGANRFPLLVTEDLLTCMDDDELGVALPLLRDTATSILHILTPKDPTADQDPRLNWKTPEDWHVLAAPDPVYDAVTNRVI